MWIEHEGEAGPDGKLKPGLRWCLGGKVRVRFTGDERELVSVWQMQHLVPYRMRANYGLDLSIAFQDEAIGGTLQVNEGAWRVAGLEDFAYIDGETTVARAKRLGGAIFEAVGA